MSQSDYAEFPPSAKLGDPYRITNAYRYNCATNTSSSSCKYVNRGASESARIIYNSKLRHDQATQIRDELKPFIKDGLPVILTGDMNTRWNSPGPNSCNTYARQDTPRDTRQGNNIDCIYLANRATATAWETVVRVDSSGNLTGVIPSDHNLIRADVSLP